jgi:5-oxopent-3-ene-1,2,5-tricarboxylate decarboxylase/2-hydroxyhepta-2,4-diene-1,7-dioate isomerase
MAELTPHPLGLAPSKIVAIHMNYGSRVREFDLPDEVAPSYFLKPPSSLSWDGAPVVRPRGCELLNYEGELALEIGRRARHVSEADALDYVGAYTVANDFSLHDFRHADRGSMLRVKGPDGYCPVGPVLVPATELDPGALSLRTFVNGELVQEGSTRELLFSCSYLIADLSRTITLEPGDLILTGTPANSRPVEPGDRVEVEIEGIGRLTNTVTDADRELGGVGVQPQSEGDARAVALGLGLTARKA